MKYAPAPHDASSKSRSRERFLVGEHAIAANCGEISSGLFFAIFSRVTREQVARERLYPGSIRGRNPGHFGRGDRRATIGS
jgi:hypothetical protein